MNNEIFKTELRVLLKSVIRRLQNSGTVAMGADNLWQVSIGGISKCPNAPMGTNCAYVARQMFNEVISEKPFVSFIITTEYYERAKQVEQERRAAAQSELPFQLADLVQQAISKAINP